MNNESSPHPAEDALLEFALHEGSRELESHVNGCEACAKTVAEFRAVKQEIASLEDAEVPCGVRDKVLGLERHRPVHGHQKGESPAPGRSRGFVSIFTNPVIVSILVLLVVLALYFLVGSEVFTAP